jgi:hypothetical protein
LTGANRSNERGRVEQRVSRALAAGVFGAVALVVALTSAAMVLYPGGTWFDRGAPEHSFFSNFLCDLLAETALNGEPNPIGSRLAFFGMMSLVIGMLPLWLMLPALMPDRPRLGRALRRMGTLGVSVLLVVPLATSERCGAYHGLVVELAGIPNFTALLLAVVGLVQTRHRSWLVASMGVALAAAALVDFGWYSWYVCRGELGSMFVPGLQKVAAILLLAWMEVVATAVWRRA